jgi:hypothetical protein
VVAAFVLVPQLALGQLFGPPQVISSGATSGRQVATADLDNDGDLDVVGASFLGDRFAWYENDGTPGGAGDWTMRSLGASNLPNSVFPARIDGDAFIDVLGANSNSVPFNNIVWSRNDGTPADGGWTVNVIANPGVGRRVFAADIDGDTDLDVIGASRDDDKLAWYVNDGTPGGFGDWAVNKLSTTVDVFTVYAVNFDGDGDIDILADANGISWWENDGTPGGLGDWAFHSIDATVGTDAAVIAADIDKDGDQDVVAASFQDNRVAWYANTNGAGTFGAAQVLSSTATSASSVFAADLDRDGDLDVLATASGTGQAVTWFENDGTPGGAGDWAAEVIDATATGASWVHAADLDGDQDLDALAMLLSGQLVWYENLTPKPVPLVPPAALAALALLLAAAGAWRGARP